MNFQQLSANVETKSFYQHFLMTVDTNMLKKLMFVVVMYLEIIFLFEESHKNLHMMMP